MSTLLRIFLFLVLIGGIGLTLINLYGLSQDLRPQHISNENLRFGDIDVELSREELFEQALKKPQESPAEYSKRLTEVIAKGLAHIHWGRYEASEFHQLVPIWENWVLHAMGRFSGIPEFQRYHFANPERSMNRGIGICGDASMIMSQLLARNGIPSNIITFPGHVVVAADVDGESFVFDPDYGVVIESSVEALNANSSFVDGAYSSAGHPPNEDQFFVRTYSQEYQVWNGVNHFITKKYYFEKFAYIIKWPVPLIMIIAALLIFRKTKTSKEVDGGER